jgi:hypothetical protein
VVGYDALLLLLLLLLLLAPLWALALSNLELHCVFYGSSTR